MECRGIGRYLGVMLAVWCLLITLGLGRAQDAVATQNEAMVREKPRATALLLAEVRADAEDDAARAQADFYIGRCLERIGLLHAAHRQYMAAAQGSLRVRTEALRHLARLAELIGDDEPLIPLAASIPEADYPPELADALLFLRARHRHRAGDASGALADLDRIPPSSPRYPAARLMLGVLRHEQGQPEAARAVLLALVRLELRGGRRTQRQELDRTQALARLTLGRIYYDAHRYEEAARLYATVSAPYTGLAALEGAWATWIAHDDPGLAAAWLARSPLARPEVDWLGVLLTPPGPSQAAQARTLHAAWRADLAALSEIQARYADDPAVLWSDWFEAGDDTAAEALPLSTDFFREALRDTRLSGAVVRMRRIDADLRELGQQPQEWRTVFEAPLREQLHIDRAALQGRAGRLLLDDVRHQIAQIEALLPQAAALSGG